MCASIASRSLPARLSDATAWADTARGSGTCMGRPGSDSHETLDAQTFASWGVDYLKVQKTIRCILHAVHYTTMLLCYYAFAPLLQLNLCACRQEDSCGGTTHGSIWDQYARMRDALNQTGRPIYYSITGIVPYNDAWPSMHVSAAAAPLTLVSSCPEVSTSLLCIVHRRRPSRLCRRVHRAPMGRGGSRSRGTGQRLPHRVLQQRRHVRDHGGSAGWLPLAARLAVASHLRCDTAAASQPLVLRVSLSDSNDSGV